MSPGHTTKDNGIIIKEHEHRLLMRHEDDSLSLGCRLCRRSIKPPFYGCDICEYYCVHKSCGDYSAQIPKKWTNYPFHNSHGHLHLIYGLTDWCRSCHRSFENAPFYRCYSCGFSIDFRCASTFRVLRGRLQKSRLTRNPKMFQSESKHHPLHDLQHGLLTPDFTDCSVCERTNDGNLGLKCQQCKFELCSNCSVRVKKNISYEDHEHLLCFVKETGKTISRCDGYDAYCRESSIASHSREFDHTKSSVFKCLDCDFKLHLLCGPLPSTIKFELHIHSLTLYDSFREDNSGEYFCDVCETQRDPRIRVYCCVECKYFAHVHCLMSEIADYFYEQNGDEHRDLKLKVLGEDSWGNSERKGTTSTLKDLLDQLKENEKHELKYYFKWEESSSFKDSNKVQPKDEDINEIIEMSRFNESEDSFQLFYDTQLWLGEGIEITSSELASKLVDAKGYHIPYFLADVLEILLEKHKYILDSFDSVSSQEMKSVVLFILCKVVKRMGSTMVNDVTINLLREWWTSLQFVNSFSNARFASEKLRKVARAFVGLQAERLEHEIPAKIDAKMEILRGCMHICKQYHGSPKTEFANGCMKEASELKWKNAF